MNYLIYFILGIFFAQFIFPLFNTFSNYAFMGFETILNRIIGKQKEEKNTIGFQIENIENTS